MEYKITHCSNSYVLPFFCSHVDLIKAKGGSCSDFPGNTDAYIMVFLRLHYVAAILKTRIYETIVSICLHFHFVLFAIILLNQTFLIIYLPLKDIYSNLAEVFCGLSVLGLVCGGFFCCCCFLGFFF